MLDIKFIRDHPEEVQKNVDFRGGKVSVVEVMELDLKRRELIQQVEKIRAERNGSSGSKPSESEIARLRKIRDKLKELEGSLAETEAEFLDKLTRLPNMSSPAMPEGNGDPDHVELAVWLPGGGYLANEKLGKGLNATQYMPRIQGKHHVELGKDLNIIDTEQSTLVSGSRFAYLKGDAALLQFALFELFKSKLLT